MNIQQLRAQIVALQDATMDENKNFHSSYDEGKFDALSAVDALLDSLQEEPISKDLEKAAVEAFKHIVDSDKNSFLEIFKAGAKWKEEQYKKNLLDVCKKQTEEEAETERDFIEGIIDEHRLPTFDDAIKYGMRLQKEQIMKEAIDAEASYTMSVPCITISLPLGVNVGDKVKVIIIKSE